ncbi:SHOCT domain-containing protein [Leifsonia poae]|uniref:SHOCT domain-containing protein n=1 Tax=Leifsonia poae TaxID=110933 RepID=UPI001CBD6F55|nr:SHOCT domain-containing protein [Leifsonia poae]
MPFIRRVGRPGLLGLAARTAVVAGTATAVAGGMRSHQEAKAQEQYEAEQFQAQQQQAAMGAAAQQAVAQATPAAPADSGGSDLMTQLSQLGALHSQGILSDDEFSAAKAKLLA